MCFLFPMLNGIKTIKDDAEAKVKEMEKKLEDYSPATIDKLKDEKNSLEKKLKKEMIFKSS